MDSVLQNFCNRWIFCNICKLTFLLQCSSVQYLTQQYCSIQLSETEFEFEDHKKILNEDEICCDYININSYCFTILSTNILFETFLMFIMRFIHSQHSRKQDMFKISGKMQRNMLATLKVSKNTSKNSSGAPVVLLLITLN